MSLCTLSGRSVELRVLWRMCEESDEHNNVDNSSMWQAACSTTQYAQGKDTFIILRLWHVVIVRVSVASGFARGIRLCFVSDVLQPQASSSFVYLLVYLSPRLFVTSLFVSLFICLLVCFVSLFICLLVCFVSLFICLP